MARARVTAANNRKEGKEGASSGGKGG